MRQVFEFKDQSDDQIDSASDVFKRVKKIDIDWGQENLIGFYLDSRNKLITHGVLFMGSLNSCVVHPRKVFREAIKHNANSVIIAHNHPSNNCKPSKDDWDVYKKLKKAGKVVSIPVLDSVIFTKEVFYSMEEKE